MNARTGIIVVLILAVAVLAYLIWGQGGEGERREARQQEQQQQQPERQAGREDQEGDEEEQQARREEAQPEKEEAPAQGPTLELVYPFSDNLVYTKSCKELAAKLNAGADGQYSVNVRPYNSINAFEQASAIQDGAVHMSCIPGAFYAKSLPENEAIAASNADPEHVRQNGGMEIIDQLHQQHLNMRYLGWIDTGPRFLIYFKEMPTFTDRGLPDMTEIKLRGNPIYSAFFNALNAQVQDMAFSEVRGALEKGTVNATAWTTIGLMDLGWDKFTNYALEPQFYQTDIGVIMNDDAWNAMSERGREIFQDIVVAHEKSSREARLAEVEAELKQLKANGMEFVRTPNAALYSKMAVDAKYDQIRNALKEMDRTTEHVEPLRARYQR